ncbi:MAG: TIGR01212 family radical SAM protein [Bacteroidales bacterium]
MIRYNQFSDYLKVVFGFKVQKISIHAGFTCPNRDGSKGYGGCTYCNNQTFSPEYCHTDLTITQQVEKGAVFFKKRNAEMRYLAYFQAYTNTYGDVKDIIAKYEEALKYPNVVGLIIGTRPDCMPDALLDYLTDLQKRTFVMVEYGVESTLDRTLDRINRGHSYEEVIDAVNRTAARGIPTGVHLILGLPGESREDILSHADKISKLPLTTVKLHQLQLIKGTRMAKEYLDDSSDFTFYSLEEYIDLAIDFVERLNPSFVVERFVSQSPKSLLLLDSNWGVKNNEFMVKLNRRMDERDSHQGAHYLAESSLCD